LSQQTTRPQFTCLAVHMVIIIIINPHTHGVLSECQMHHHQ
jgi:hypothetical protein